MTQINQYTTEALSLGPEDLVDIDKNIGVGQWESQKVKWGTILSSIGGAGNNLGNSDLTQTDTDRFFDASGGNLDWKQLQRFYIFLKEWGDNPINGFKVERSHGPSIRNKNRMMAEFLSTALLGDKSYLRVFEEGRVDMPSGGLGVADGSVPMTLTPSNSSNAGLLALFLSSLRPTVFTDFIVPEEPTTFEPQNSAIVWFRSFSKGVLFPNMGTIQRDAILTPEKGLVIYNIDTDKLQVYNGVGMSGWQNLN